MKNGAQILRFPVEKGMPTDVARYKIGTLKRFRYPNPDNIEDGIEEWVEKFLLGKSVVFGWGPINKGLVEVFRAGNVRHIVSRVGPVVVSNRPYVEVCCHGDTLFPLYNWISENRQISLPVSLLSMDQINYFRICKKCDEYMVNHGSTGCSQRR